MCWSWPEDMCRRKTVLWRLYNSINNVRLTDTSFTFYKNGGSNFNIVLPISNPNNLWGLLSKENLLKFVGIKYYSSNEYAFNPTLTQSFSVTTTVTTKNETTIQAASSLPGNDIHFYLGSFLLITNPNSFFIRYKAYISKIEYKKSTDTSYTTISSSSWYMLPTTDNSTYISFKFTISLVGVSQATSQLRAMVYSYFI